MGTHRMTYNRAPIEHYSFFARVENWVCSLHDLQNSGQTLWFSARVEQSKWRLRCLFLPQALSAKAWSPKGRRGKENTLPVKQQVGFEPGTFWSTVECFNHLATVSVKVRQKYMIVSTTNGSARTTQTQLRKKKTPTYVQDVSRECSQCVNSKCMQGTYTTQVMSRSNQQRISSKWPDQS